MNYTVKYGSSVLVLPGDNILPAIKNASREELAVLIYIAKYPNADTKQCLSDLNLKSEQLIGAMIYWKNAGFVDFKNEDLLKESKDITSPKEYPAKEFIGSKLPRASSVPHYTSEETAAFLEANQGVASLIDCCQTMFGKLFNTAETEIIIGMMDYLSLDADYILLLFEHCANIGKKSVRYAEKTAISLTDRGISKYKELEEYFTEIAKSSSFEATLRDMLGIGKREFTKKERTAISKWCSKWGFSADSVRRAYDITVNRIDKPSIDYIDAILKSWHAAGAVTPEAIDQLIKSEENDKKQNGSTFETDDFFEAAIMRSYKQ